jgi:L-asparaginase
MNAPQPLVFLSCGGTIEKVVLAACGQLGFDQSRLSDWLQQCRLDQPWRSETLMLIDSLEMTDTHRETLARHISTINEGRIVVVHGTDTMVESAAAVMLQRKAHQTIVFTGAMLPVSVAASDGLFNLGLATAAVQLLPPGVYIAMSGQVFPADQVRKNRARARFEPSTMHPVETPATVLAETTNDGNSDTSAEDNGTLRITKRRVTGFFR